MKYFYWTETNTNFTVSSSIVTAPIQEDYHPAQRTNSDTVYRSLWFPRLDVRVDRASGAPTAYWWTGATVYLIVVFDSDSSFPPVGINLGTGDPRTMGVCSLIPEATVYDSTFATVTTFRGPAQGLDLRDRRKGLGADILPQVVGNVWGFDNHGVLDNSHSSHVTTRLSMISRVLWASDSPT